MVARPGMASLHGFALLVILWRGISHPSPQSQHPKHMVSCELGSFMISLTIHV